jgi:S-layer protein
MLEIVLLKDPSNRPLTTGTEAVAGTAQDDTITGVISDAEKTLNVSDTIDGGAGSDTLSLVVGTAAAAVSLDGFTVSGVENFSVRNVSGQTASQNFALITGETSFTSNVSTSAVTVTNLAAGATATIVGNGAATNGATNIGYEATATAGALAITSGVTAGAVTLSGTKVASQSISSTGATNAIGALELGAATTALTIDAATKLTTGAITNNTAAALKSIVITGAGAVDIDAATLPTTATTVDASAATGAIDVAAGNVTDGGVGSGTLDTFDFTATTGSGNDKVSVAAIAAGKEYSVSTGEGDDAVTIGAALVSATSTVAGTVINGGAGNDTLVTTSALANAQAAVTSVSGFEVLTISDALAANFSAVSHQATGLTTVNLNLGGTGTITMAAGTNTVNLKGALTGALGVTDTGTATTDAVTLSNGMAATDAFAGQNLTSTGFEALTINTTGSGAATAQTIGTIGVTVDTGGTAVVNFVGSNSVSTGVITAKTVDASGLTGTATFTNVGATSGVTSITGSANADTIVGSATATTINAGAGNDTITGGAAADTINGGDGNDTINGGGGADTINGGAGKDAITLNGTTSNIDAGDGDDTVTAAGNLAFGVTVVGGAGTDTISVNAGVSAADGSVVSGFEQLTLSTAGTIAVANFGNNTFSTVSVGALAASTISGIGAQTIQVTGVMTGDLTLTYAGVVTGTSDSQTIEFKSAAAVVATNEIVAAGIETINLISTDTDTTAHANTVQLTVAAAKTLNITGNAGVDFTGSADVSKVETLDASGLVLGAVTATGVTYAASYNTVGGVTTIIGSNGIDNFNNSLAGTNGGNTNDTISAGSGADIIGYAGGADTFTGGAGADTFDINALSAGTASSKVVITDLAVGDKIDVATIDAGTGVADAALGAKGSLGSAATFQNYLDNAAAATTGATAAVAKWFQFDGNTFLVIDNSNNGTFTAGTDSVIQINGLVDLSTSAFLAGALTIA